MSSESGVGRADDILPKLSLRTKAIMISTEFTHGKMGPEDLREVLEVIAPSADERTKIVTSVEEELRAARYPAADILRLVGVLSGPLAERSGEETQQEPAAADPNVLVTRKVRSPSMIPFGKFDFHADQHADKPMAPQEQGEAGEPSKPDEDTNFSPLNGRFRFSAGGETAGMKADSFKGLSRKKEKKSSGGPSILVADDDARSRMMYRAKLEEEGYKVTEAKDGVEAWNHIRQGAVQGAVMDMKMPGYHGLEVLSRMIDSNLILPVVVVSAFDQLANEFVVATYPKLTFLTKPAPPEEVAGAVKNYIPSGRGD